MQSETDKSDKRKERKNGNPIPRPHCKMQFDFVGKYKVI